MYVFIIIVLFHSCHNYKNGDRVGEKIKPRRVGRKIHVEGEKKKRKKNVCFHHRHKGSLVSREEKELSMSVVSVVASSLP